MGIKRLKYVIAFAALIILMATVFLFLIIPDKRLSIQEPEKYASMEEYKKFKLQQGFNNIIDNTERALTFSISSEELNEILAIQYKEISSKVFSDIKGFKGEISEGRIKIYLDSNIFKIIPAQYEIELIPSIDNNRVAFYLSRARIGQVPLPKKLAISRIKKLENEYFSVNLDKSDIVLKNSLPSQFAFKSIVVKDKEIEIQVGIFIQSIKDFLEVAGTVLPEDLKQIIDKIPIDSLTREGMEALKDISLNQANDLIKSIKSGALKEAVRKLEEAGSSGTLEGFDLDSLKSKADKTIDSLEKNNGTGLNSVQDNIKNKIIEEVEDKLNSESVEKNLTILEGIFKGTKE